MPKAKVSTLVGLDGFERKPDEEEALNSVFKGIFSKDQAGQAVLSYLRQITIETVAGPEVTTDKLRHLEGQRYIVGLIQRRVNKGRSQQIVEESKDG